jgi:hypothetical protein
MASPQYRAPAPPHYKESCPPATSSPCTLDLSLPPSVLLSRSMSPTAIQRAQILALISPTTIALTPLSPPLSMRPHATAPSFRARLASSELILPAMLARPSARHAAGDRWSFRFDWIAPGPRCHRPPALSDRIPRCFPAESGTARSEKRWCIRAHSLVAPCAGACAAPPCVVGVAYSSYPKKMPHTSTAPRPPSGNTARASSAS